MRGEKQGGVRGAKGRRTSARAALPELLLQGVWGEGVACVFGGPIESHGKKQREGERGDMLAKEGWRQTGAGY